MSTSYSGLHGSRAVSHPYSRLFSERFPESRQAMVELAQFFPGARSRMTPERWKRIDELVQGALDLPPEDRAAFVDSQCGGDAGLRSVVASLISHQGNMSGLPGSPAIEDAAASMEEGRT